MDDFAVVGAVFFGAVLVCWLVVWFVGVLAAWVDRKNPLHDTRRNMNGRKSMASEWRKPTHLPEDWE